MNPNVSRPALVARVALIICIAGIVLSQTRAVVAQAPSPAPTPSIVGPDGVGPVKFGMSIDDAKKQFPDAPRIEPTPGDPRNPPFHYAELTLKGQTVDELKGCDLTLRFFQGALINVLATCGADQKDKVDAYLRNKYGQPHVKNMQAWEWQGTKSSITSTEGTGRFAVSDNAGNKGFQMMLLALAAQQGALMPGGQQAAPPGATAAPVAP